jgi:arylsulfatase
MSAAKADAGKGGSKAARSDSADKTLVSDILPLATPRFRGRIGNTYVDSEADLIDLPTAPAGAPNVLLVVLDDVGFGQTSTFGGPANTPTLQRLADRGLRYNRFHTTALCSPTRAALLSGRNHHSVHTGVITEMATGFPGYDGSWPREAASIAEILRGHHYSTAAFGKWHNTPDHELSAAGPFDRWPTGKGFDYWYGFQGGEASQWHTPLFENTAPIDRRTTTLAGTSRKRSLRRRSRGSVSRKLARRRSRSSRTSRPGRVTARTMWPGNGPTSTRASSTRLVDRMVTDCAVDYITRNAKGDRPFFLYVPFAFAHHPALAHPDFKGKSPAGEFGDSLLEHDHNVGRLLDALAAAGIADNTVVIWASDNGPSPLPTVTPWWTIGDAGPACRNIASTPSQLVGMEEALKPTEKNGVTIIDVTPEKLTFRQYVWRPPQPVSEIDTMKPALVYEVPGRK